MSFNSPAKQERIERHLMRQRGAGVRTVSSNFGFAFGPLSAPTSNDATPTHELQEPPAKRRKTVLSNEIVATESTIEKDVDVSKSKQATKPRRKLDLDLENDPSRAAAAADDSFIAALGTKRTTTAKSKTNKTPSTKPPAIARSKAKAIPATRSEPLVEILEYQPPTRSRPRRCAAATAASKVVEGIEKEVTHVDEKQEVAKAGTKGGRSRKKDVAVEQDIIACEVAEPVLPDYTSEVPVNGVSKKRGPGRIRKAKDDGIAPPQIADVVVDEENGELATNAAVPHHAKATAHEHEHERSQKRVSKNAPKASKKKEASVKKTRQKTVEAVSRAERSTGSTFDVAGDGDGDLKDDECAASSRSTRASRTQRRPLAETNMNITMRSVSPEKLPQVVPNESTFQAPKPKQQPKKTAPNHTNISPTKPEPKRRKLNIKRDAVETTSQCSGSAAETKFQPGDLPETEVTKKTSLDLAEKTVASAAHQRQGRGAGSVAAQRRTNLMHEAKEDADPGNVSASKTARAPVRDDPKAQDTLQADKSDQCASADTRDEDVDWLFAPQPQANFSKPPTMQAKSKRDSKVSRGKFKMPEMDLDDLLSNIATFAQEKTRSGAVVAKDVRLFAGGGRKGRSGASKRTRS